MSNPHYAFCPKWFKKNQSKILFLLNNKITRKIFRILLCIDCKETINKITPNSYTFGAKINGDKLEIKTDFRTHNKYSKNMYNAFKPIWWSMHFFDWSIADRWIPKLSFGFSTLTVYPDSPAATTCEGYVLVSGVNSTFSTIRSASGNGSSVSNTFEAIDLMASSTSNQYDTLTRCIGTFDTSSLGSGATINNAVLSIYGTAKDNLLGSIDFHIGGATPASNSALVNADYGQCQTTSFGSIVYSSYSTSSYNDITLNSSGLSNISKTGISKFSFQTSWDINNSFTGSWVSLARSYLGFRGVGSTGTSQDPKLVVTYNLITSNPAFFLNFL